ncbi:hypothetical protein DFH29DRAFT_871454 [Suillus ampliporus]|nr:hypothetical protein DFH29DRAFT_871454 [Suillus ampliporus]
MPNAQALNYHKSCQFSNSQAYKQGLTLASSKPHFAQQPLGKFIKLGNTAMLGSQQQMAGLVDRGIGIWPTQLPQYAEVVSLADDAYADTSVPMKKVHVSVLVTFLPTDVDLTSINRPRMIGDWRELVHPLGGTYYYNSNKRFQYYYAVPDCRVITWLEDLNGCLLFSECIKPSDWEHKNLELEAQYWKHIEFFPHTFQMGSSEVRRIRRKLSATLGMSLIKWTAGHYQYLNRHNQPEARLIRSHAVIERRIKYKCLSLIGNAAAMMLCMPITVERIRDTSVDGIINGVEVQAFIDAFSNQTKNQINLVSTVLLSQAGVSMALDIAILAIPGLGTTVTAQAYYLQKRVTMLVIVTSIPTSFCVLRIAASAITSILGFLAGMTIDFKPSTPLVPYLYWWSPVMVQALQGYGRSEIFVLGFSANYRRFGMECVVVPHEPCS